jgi:hypothetical protein
VDQLFASLPIRVIAIGAIILGFVFIILNDPPKTVCDSQLEVFKDAQGKFIFPIENKGVRRQAVIEKEFETCRQSAEPGGCFELFEKLKRLVADLENIPKQCTSSAGGIKEVKRSVLESLRIFTLLAWGEKAPISYTQRFGWLDTADVALFCRLKHQFLVFYGPEAWAEFRTATFHELPQAGTLTPEQLWQRSIMSTSCESYR